MIFGLFIIAADSKGCFNLPATIQVSPTDSLSLFKRFSPSHARLSKQVYKLIEYSVKLCLVVKKKKKKKKISQ